MKRIVQTGGFLRKETASLVRQPRLLLVLVAGPFLVLLLFGIGYDQEQTVLRTAFIGPEGSVYEETIEQFADDMRRYVDDAGYSDDLAGAEARLRNGEIDAIVVFPTDPLETVLGGDQAQITVIHDKIDPLQQVAVEVSAQVAVMELNARVLESALGQAQDTLEPIAAQVEAVTGFTLAQVAVDPQVIVRPFTSDTESLQREPITTNDYFAPAAVALLLQHMVLTFAAMSLVTDRRLGLFEIYRVGPVDAPRVMVGKYLAFLLVGAAVGAALLAAVVELLEVPLRGGIAWVAVGAVGTMAASIGLGMTLSLVARSEVQAVQFAMLALLTSLFFGGLFLSLDAFDYPVKLVSLLLPVSYGIEILRDVMLRGSGPDRSDLAGLAATTVGFGCLAWWLLRRQLRVR